MTKRNLQWYKETCHYLEFEIVSNFATRYKGQCTFNNPQLHRSYIRHCVERLREYRQIVEKQKGA